MSTDRFESPAVILRRYGLRPKHSWGQNFLGDERSLELIAKAAALSADDTVVELGAGLGHLTRILLETGARVVAVERDRDLAKVLQDLEKESPRLKVVEANATELGFAEAGGVERVCVVGNLPYHLSSSILFAVLEQRRTISRAVFTLQAEVVDRLAAPPGTKAYGLLPALLSLYFDIERVARLPASLFHPPPKVDSAVVSLWALEKPLAEVSDDAHFIKVVKAAFAQRRKTLSNSLKSDPALGTKEILEEALAAANIDGGRRAETLSSTEFAALERELAKRESVHPERHAVKSRD